MKLIATVAIVLVAATPASAQLTPVDWSSTGPGRTASGSAAGITFNMSDFVATPLIEDPRYNTGFDYSGADYSVAPLGSSVNSLLYGGFSDWTLALSQPVPQLFLYVGAWRGNIWDGQVDPATNYVFSQPFTIVSGLSGASTSGNTLTLPDDVSNGAYYNGILRFNGPITSLSVDSSMAFNGSLAMTFAVPEPSMFAAAIGAMAAGMLRRRR
jgi:hypothetical protein